VVSNAYPENSLFQFQLTLSTSLWIIVDSVNLRALKWIRRWFLLHTQDLPIGELQASASTLIPRWPPRYYSVAPTALDKRQ
ncbi:MAG: hypothetical protein ACOVOD_17945, partial [Rhodoferax sp.]